jgi:hypothetical protein
MIINVLCRESISRVRSYICTRFWLGKMVGLIMVNVANVFSIVNIYNCNAVF